MTDIIKSFEMIDSKDVLKRLKAHPAPIEQNVEKFREELQVLESLSINHDCFPREDSACNDRKASGLVILHDVANYTSARSRSVCIGTRTFSRLSATVSVMG